jgi:hypothetical protein
LEAFAENVVEKLGDVNSDYRMSDGRTVAEYLALSDAQGATLWEEAFREVMKALEKEPEEDASADYVPAGQGHRAQSI